jgi:hypothetical protein
MGQQDMLIKFREGIVRNLFELGHLESESVSGNFRKDVICLCNR